MSAKEQTKRQETMLRIARNIWHLQIDCALPCDKTARKEIDRLLRLAKATRDDL